MDTLWGVARNDMAAARRSPTSCCPATPIRLPLLAPRACGRERLREDDVPPPPRVKIPLFFDEEVFAGDFFVVDPFLFFWPLARAFWAAISMAR